MLLLLGTLQAYRVWNVPLSLSFSSVLVKYSTTAACWQTPRPGSSLTDVRPSLRRLHHSNVLLRLSVSSPYSAWSLLYISAGLTPSFTRNLITARCSMYALTLPSAILINGLLDWPATWAPPISNRTHLPLTTACSIATLESPFYACKIKSPGLAWTFLVLNHMFKGLITHSSRLRPHPNTVLYGHMITLSIYQTTNRSNKGWPTRWHLLYYLLFITAYTTQQVVASFWRWTY